MKKLVLELTDEQFRHIAIAVALLNAKIGNVAGAAPTDHGCKASGLVGASRDERLFAVPLSAEDIRALCGDMASELYNDSLMGKHPTIDEDDFAGVLRVWRAHSPHYVEEIRAGYRRLRAKGYTGPYESRRDLEETRAMHDATADRLERLLRFIPAMEVHHG